LATTADLIEQEYVSALEDYAETEVRRGNHVMLTQRLAGWVSDYPLRETLRGSYIIALARSGRQAAPIEGLGTAGAKSATSQFRVSRCSIDGSGRR
jgi:DNA-binding SARP family transcriptional activator